MDAIVLLLMLCSGMENYCTIRYHEETPKPYYTVISYGQYKRCYTISDEAVIKECEED